MEKINDLILRYGVILGKRSTEKQKIKFLQAAQLQFKEYGLPVETTKATFKRERVGEKNYYNLYAGDIKNADVIITTYYDTPLKSFGLFSQEAFNNDNNNKSLIISLLISILFVLLTAGILYIFIIPRFAKKNFLSVWGLLTLLILFLSIYIVSKIRYGIANRHNMIRNTSSLLTQFMMIDTFKNKKVAYAMIDDGTNGTFGLKMLKSYFDFKDKTVISLDSIGNEGDLIFYAHHSDEDLLEGATRIRPFDDYREYGDILVTSGTVNSNKKVVIPNANTHKDKNLNEEDLINKVKVLEKVIKNILIDRYQ